jgi:polyisoprenoid-binding protein YceI
LRKEEAQTIRKAAFLGVATLTLFGFVLFHPVVAVTPHQGAAQQATSEIALTIDPAQSKIHWTVDSSLHVVHGTFEVDSGTLRFDHETGRAAGEIVVHAITGQSGNKSRDTRMHKEILETAKYPDVVFRPAQLEGKLAPSGVSEGKLHGTLVIHGAEHDLTAVVHAELAGGRWKGTGQFEVPYVKWGIKDPSNFLLRVSPVVNLELELAGPVGTAK